MRGWDAYASGYLEAANLLVEKALETGQRTDTLIYPVAFLYRHYLELRLKEITIQGGELISGQREFRLVHAYYRAIHQFLAWAPTIFIGSDRICQVETLSRAPAEFPARKALDVQVRSAEECGRLSPRFVTGISNQALLARIALARASRGVASSRRPTFRHKDA